MSPWEEKYVPAFVSALNKLPLADLTKLTEMFDCAPRFEERDDPRWHVSELLTKLSDNRRDAEAAKELRAALAVLRLR